MRWVGGLMVGLFDGIGGRYVALLRLCTHLRDGSMVLV
jgi:hypothetical protein